MCRFIETIAVLDGVPERLEYHQRRLKRTLNEKNIPGALDLSAIYSPKKTGKGLWKWRVVYGGGEWNAQYTAYTKREITELVPVICDSIDYHLKYLNRDSLESLKLELQPHQEILIIKNGMVTDTSYTNVVLFDGKEYVTPDTPLLPGTRRAYLLDRGLITAKTIPFETLGRYREIHLVNAFIGVGDLVVPFGFV